MNKLERRKRRIEQASALVWWAILALLPYIFLKVLNASEYIFFENMGDEVDKFILLMEIDGVIELLVLTMLKALAMLSIPIILIYVALSMLGFRFSFRKERKPIWRT